MLIKVLYVVLVVSFIALVGVAGACYVRVRRHLKASKTSILERQAQEQQGQALHERTRS